MKTNNDRFNRRYYVDILYRLRDYVIENLKGIKDHDIIEVAGNNSLILEVKSVFYTPSNINKLYKNSEETIWAILEDNLEKIGFGSVEEYIISVNNFGNGAYYRKLLMVTFALTELGILLAIETLNQKRLSETKIAIEEPF